MSSSSTQQQGVLDRTAIPTAGPTPQFVAPTAKEYELDNGLGFISVPKNTLPLIHARVIIKSGSSSDPENLPGVADFLAEVLKAGTATKTAEELAREIENRGSSIGISVGEDSISLTFTSMREHFSDLFDIATDMLLNPTFNANTPATAERLSREMERIRKRRLATLTQVNADARSVASRIFRRAVYGEHPYGHDALGTTTAIENIQTTQLKEFYQSHFQPRNSAVVIVGAITKEDARKAVEKRLGVWHGSARNDELPSAKRSEHAGKVVLVDKPGAPQSQIRIGHLGLPRHHQDYFPLIMCNAILGGLFNSRINMNLREDKGYTYGARTSFSFLQNGGSFTAHTGVRTDVTVPAIQEVINEIKTIRDTDVTEEELTNAKNRYSLSLPGQFQTLGAIASSFENILVYDLPMDYYHRVPEHLEAVTISDVRRVAKEHLKLDNLTVVVVGDKSKVEPEVALLNRGMSEEWDATGKKL